MARWLCAALCVITVGTISSQAPADHFLFSDADPSASPRLTQLKAALKSSGRTAALETFWADIRRDGAPLIEAVPGEPNYSWVTFLWQAAGKTTNVAVVDGVAAGVGGVDATKSLMLSIEGTDVWYRTYKVRNDAAFTYTLSPNDTLEKFTGPRKSKPQMDPLNQNRSGPQSFVRLASAPQLTESAAAPRGTVTSSSFASRILQNTRVLQVYTPPGFATTGERYPLLVVLDAGAYADYVPVPKILDTLIAEQRIQPIVAVLVGNAARAQELTCSPAYADFLAMELVPWMRETYFATTASDKTIVAGSSLGGLASAFAAFQHPDVFGNVLSQSGSYWGAPADQPGEWLTHQFAAAGKKALRISMSVGAMEISEQLDANRRLRDVLTAKGYVLDYSEFNGNHSYIGWRTDLARAIQTLNLRR